ncbi:MAG: acylphosphatase [Nanoarchaeota archaeon]|nr:acylphosphatase [Nanoarchaeota archaeon]
MQQIHIIVKGRVQGVFFRARTKEQAIKLDITGWVKNLDNGDVEILAQGTEENLAKFLGWVNHGPEIARVDDVDVKKEELEKKYDAFGIKY